LVENPPLEPERVDARKAATMDLEIHYDPNGEWAALYKDGDLVRVGDAYLAEEQAFELLGVRIVRDDAFLRGQDSREGVAQTVELVDEYRSQRDNALSLAAQKRAEADRLIAEAKELER
jgi:hypothetical protein